METDLFSFEGACDPYSEGDAIIPSRTRLLKWTRRLVITKQPSSEFYKDEGWLLQPSFAWLTADDEKVVKQIH